MRRMVRVLAAVAALLILAALALPFLIDPNDLRPLLEEKLTQALGREVKLGSLKLSLLSGGVTAADLSIADDPAYSRAPFVQAKSLKVGVELWPLIASRKLNVTGLTIAQPAISLIQSSSGEWNFSNLGSPGDKAAKTGAAAPEPSAKNKLDLSVKLVKIAGGRFSLGKTGGHARPLVLEDVDVEVRDFSSTSVFPFTFAAKVAGGGTIKLDGKAGPLDPVDVAASPVSANLKVDQLDLAGSGITQSAPSLGGLISFEGSGESNGQVAQVKGRIKAAKLKLARDGTVAARPLEFDFAVDHNLRKRSGQLRKGDIRISGAPASLTGGYAGAGESVVLNMNLAGPKMPVPELAAMLPVMGIVLPAGSSLQGGTASVKLSLVGPLERLVTTGSLSLDNTKLAGFDLGGKMAFIEKLAGINRGPDTEIQTFGAHMRLGPEGLAAENIQLIVPALGNLEGGGVVSPAKALAFKMRATVHTSGMLAAAGNTPIPFVVEGTAAHPVFRPDMKSLAKEQLKNLAKPGAAVAATGFLKGLLGGKKN
jgi:AsmA protein